MTIAQSKYIPGSKLVYLPLIGATLFLFSSASWSVCAMPQPGMTLWIPGDNASGNMTPALIGPNPTMYGAQIQGSGKVLNTVAIAEGGYLNIPNGSSVNLGKGDFSIDFWIKNLQPQKTVSILDSRTGQGGGNQANNKNINKKQRFPTKSQNLTTGTSGPTGVHVYLYIK